MLRNFIPSPKKELSVPPLREVKETAVRVQLHDPLTGEELGLSDQYVTTISELDAKSQVREDSADLYSIENLQSIGMPPVVCNGNYINDDVISYNAAQNLSAKLRNQIEKADYLKSLLDDHKSIVPNDNKPIVQNDNKPTVQPSKTE